MTYVRAGAGGGLLSYTTIVGNSLEGDTASDVDFLDTGDGAMIQAAITALPASGGTILIRKGTYTLTTSLTLNRSDIRLLGEGVGSTVIGGPTGADNLMDVGDGVTLRSNIQIEGITFIDNEPALPTNGGIIVDGVSDMLVSECEFIGSAFPGGWVGFGMADSGALGGGQSRVVNCRFAGSIGALFAPATLSGVVAFNGVNSVQFIDNLVEGTGGGGYLVLDSVNGMVINGNVWNGGNATCVDAVNSTQNLTVDGNVMRNNDGSFLEIISGGGQTSREIVVSNNLCENSADTAITIQIGSNGAPVSNVVVEGNVIQNGATGILLEDADFVTITGNHINGVSGAGLQIRTSSSSAVFDGNHLESCGTAIFIQNDGMIVSNNIINGCTTGINVANSDCIITGNLGDATITTDFIDTGDRNHWDNNWFQLPTVITADGVATRLFDMPVQSDKNYTYEVTISAKRTDVSNQERFSEVADITVSVNSTNTPSIGTPTIVHNDQSPAAPGPPSATYTALPGPGTFFIDVTGIAAQTWEWSARIKWRNN